MKKKSMVFLVTLVLIAGTISGCGSSKTTTEVKAGENQQLAYAMVTAIEGNEMTYREVDQSMVSRLKGTNRSSKTSTGSQSSSGTQKKGSGNSQSSQNSGNSKQWQGSGSGNSKQSQGGSNNSQQSKIDATEMPSMNKESSSATASEKTKGSEGNSTSKGSGSNSSMMSGKTTTVQIPVGVAVHTATNTNTTFSRIRSGDILELLLQKDDDGKEVIVGIWMLK
jgi:hypothetical protein